MDSSRYDAAELVEPPISVESVSIMALAGTALCGVAFLLGQVAQGEETPLSGIRVILTVIGIILAGGAINQNGTWFGGWFLGALTCLVGHFGFPQSWDSFRLVADVFAGLSLAGGVVLLLPIYPRMLLITGVVVIHFGLILTAVTAPTPSPWLSQQIWNRYARPYLYFAYLNNAYQFYSPDPGPATELWFLIEYQFDAEPAVASMIGPGGQSAFDLKYAKKWYKIPKRPSQVKDPFAQTYYRRLSLSEYAAHTMLSLPPITLQNDLTLRRNKEAQFIPHSPLTVPAYAEPTDEVKRSIIPSYIRHVAFEYAKPGPDMKGSIKSIKLFRVQHRIISLALYLGAAPDEATPQKFYYQDQPARSVYDPSYYLPYYMGSYDTEGHLKDRSKDPFVYYIIPIVPNYDVERPPANASMRKLTPAEYNRFYKDFVNQLTGSDHRQGD